jgi:hypothetical protein
MPGALVQFPQDSPAMSPQVTAAIISDSVAFADTLVGIAGAVIAQASATIRTLWNSLALFERERQTQEQERQEQARRKTPSDSPSSAEGSDPDTADAGAPDTAPS